MRGEETKKTELGTGKNVLELVAIKGVFTSRAHTLH